MKAVIPPRIAPIEDLPLCRAERPMPRPGPGQVRVRVSACGVCHIDLDEIEGRLRPARLPIVQGHQIVGPVKNGGIHAAAVLKIGSAAKPPGANRVKKAVEIAFLLDSRPNLW